MALNLKLLKIKVEDKHIKNGLRGESRYCPISLAIKDYLYDRNKFFCTKFSFIKVYSHHDYISINYLGQRLVYKTTKKASKFIKNFDHSKGVIPDTFHFKRVNINSI